MTIYLNVRRDLTKQTRDKMKKLCLEQKITMGILLNNTFK